MAASKPWTHHNGSSSSPGGVEITTSPGQSSLGPRRPSPADLVVYGAKPLPRVPMRRSLVSSFSSEVNNALCTPKRSVDYQERAPPDERGEADVGSIPQRVTPARPVRPRVDISHIPDTPPDDILSPQPKRAVRKILRLTGGSSPATSPSSLTSPSGHNPSQKIRQLTGLDISSHLPGMELSPVSPLSGSSVYSDDLRTTISEPDVDTYMDDFYVGYSAVHHEQANHRRPSEWPPWAVESPADVPAALAVRSSSLRYSDSAVGPTDSLSRRHRSGLAQLALRHRRGSSYGTELYHATATQIAQSSVQAEEARLSSQGSTGSLNYSLPLNQRKESFSDRVSVSRVRIAPPAPLRPASSQASRGRDSFSTGSHQLKTPYPAQSSFDDDSSGDESSKHRSTKLGSLAARAFKRDSGVVEITSSFASSTVVTSGRRRAEGPDTPFPTDTMLQRTGDQLSGLVARAKKMGLRSRAERRRDSLKNKIRVIPESGPASEPEQ